MNPLTLSYNRHAYLIECLAQRGDPLAASEHFALYQLESPDPELEPELVLVHHFAARAIDNNVGYFVANELLPLLGTDRQADFEHLVGAIVRSTDCSERRAWWRFYDNTLAALARVSDTVGHDFIAPFGAIYRQVMQLTFGHSLLDAGTCFGFLPLLFARSDLLFDLCDGSEKLTRIVGCDLDYALVRLANGYAASRQFSHVSFAVADILAADSARLGTFDTVTAIHLLEHLPPEQTRLAVEQLWQRTNQRLIISVPLEETPDPRFGHLQVFNQERLLALGRELSPHCRYFEFHGGWLLVDK